MTAKKPPKRTKKVAGVKYTKTAINSALAERLKTRYVTEQTITERWSDDENAWLPEKRITKTIEREADANLLSLLIKFELDKETRATNLELLQAKISSLTGGDADLRDEINSWFEHYTQD